MAAQATEGYIKGFAFIVEGPTERVFYHEYLMWCCGNMYGCAMEQLPDKDYLVRTGKGDVLVKFNVMGSVNSIPNAMSWVRSTCTVSSGFLDYRPLL